MKKQYGKGPQEIDEALKVLEEYEDAKKQYEISEAERERIVAEGDGWSQQKEKISQDASKKQKN